MEYRNRRYDISFFKHVEINGLMLILDLYLDFSTHDENDWVNFLTNADKL